MRGKRAPDLACGLLLQVVNEMFDVGLTVLLSECVGLTSEELQQITEQYSSARSRLCCHANA